MVGGSPHSSARWSTPWGPAPGTGHQRTRERDACTSYAGAAELCYICSPLIPVTTYSCWQHSQQHVCSTAEGMQVSCDPSHCIRRRSADDTADEEDDDDRTARSSRDSEVQLRLPLSFRLAGSPTGKADLQLQLLSLRIGDACEPGRRSGRGRRRHGRLGSAPQLAGQPWRKPIPFLCSGMSTCSSFS